MYAAQTAVTADRIMQTALGFASAKILLSAVELGVFTELAKGPADAATLGGRLGLHPRGTRDFFDALAAIGLLRRENGLYANSTDADTYLDRAKPTYIGGVLEMIDHRLYKFWGSLTEALRTGKRQNETKDDPDVFGKLYDDPARLREFLSAMTGLSLPAARAIAAKFTWRDYGTFCDVGCAQGGAAVQIALAQPQLRGIGMDLPQVRPIFADYIASFGLSDRLSFETRDFFTEPLPPADVLVMGHILHDWDLETKRMLLAKAYQALPKGGSLIVYEMLIDDERAKPEGLIMSLNMLIETAAGFDYTGADCQAWMHEAGFRETYVEALTGAESMVVGKK